MHLIKYVLVVDLQLCLGSQSRETVMNTNWNFYRERKTSLENLNFRPRGRTWYSTPKKSSMVCAYWIPAFLSKTWEAEKKAQKRSWSKLNSKERFPSNQNGCFQEYHLVYCLSNLVVSSSGSFANQFTVMGGIWAGCQNPFPKILRLSGDPVKTLGTTVTKKFLSTKKKPKWRTTLER